MIKTFYQLNLTYTTLFADNTFEMSFVSGTAPFLQLVSFFLLFDPLFVVRAHVRLIVEKHREFPQLRYLSSLASVNFVKKKTKVKTIDQKSYIIYSAVLAIRSFM